MSFPDQKNCLLWECLLRWDCLLLGETETPSHFETVNTPASYPYSSHKTRHQVSGNSVTEPGVS